ncbi:unnamed protein product [Clonostachys rosea f. rosea IK726]|uniref:Uncharacterized protein n=4 Tax=Clonostachys TaxID=110564 RepID=A0A9N9V9N0_9HYPO|nr:unnamed protein product [Clonostachys rosea f. rosea IK726]CAH0019550.1 unnamed protein product [Clonostachys rhizophaga]CAH0019584.1 unnamed protein product [Clonostachys rhizophaga]CAH0019586.1 unnamed protein product [Clonostachys rhizophaga]CAH0020115.1 unnamed protein product [Clonostachys rhizophaga]
MSTAEYFVNVLNKSEETQNYLFFNQKPDESSSVGKIYTNVWIRSPGVPSPRGKAEFDVKVANFAICGTTPEPVDYGVVVSTSDYAAVELTTRNKPGTSPLMDIVDDGPQFVEPYGTTNKDNSFGIQTNPFNPDQYKTVYCGYGKYNDKNQVVPVAVWRAKPFQKYDLTPVIKYYVSTGNYKPGTTVDITTLGAVSEIDFTKAKPGQVIATVTHNSDGTYSDPTFSYPEKARPYSGAS